MKRLAMGCAVVVSLVAALLESPAPGEERELLEPSELARVLRMSPLEQTIFDRHCAIFSVIKCFEFLEVKYPCSV